MITIQPTLINFTAFQNLGLFGSTVRISQSGIVHDSREICGDCGALCCYNGSSNKGVHSLSNPENSFLRKGQQRCQFCSKTIQVENEWLNSMINSINMFIKAQIISLSEQLSEQQIVDHLKSTMTITISKGTVHNVIKEVNKTIDAYEFNYEIVDNFYAYDEQFLKINGKQVYRLVIFDLKNNTIIYQEIHKRLSKKILRQVLLEVFGDTKPKGFVVDMRVEYPNAFENVFGKKIKLQFCLFHLNKLILKEYRDSLKVGKDVKWKLRDQYYLYTLFNIFYNREGEINILKSMMENLDNFRKKLSQERINHFVKEKKLKIKDKKKLEDKIVDIQEKKLLKKFRKLVHDKKNERRRKGNKKTLDVRTIDSATKIFEEVNKRRSIYPDKIRKRIIKIGEKFKYFTASEGAVLTTNKLEGLFGATLRQFRKKSSRCFLSISSLLKRKRARKEGVEFFRKFSVPEIAKIFAVVLLFT